MCSTAQELDPPWDNLQSPLGPLCDFSPLSWIWNYKTCQGINWPTTLDLPLLTFSLALPWGPVQRPGTMYVCITFIYDARILMTGNEVRQKVFIVHVFLTTLCLSKQLSQNSSISLEPHKRHFKKKEPDLVHVFYFLTNMHNLNLISQRLTTNLWLNKVIQL